MRQRGDRLRCREPDRDAGGAAGEADQRRLDELVRPFDVSIKLSRGYYVVCRGSDWTQRPIATFREWLMAQARGDVAAAN